MNEHHSDCACCKHNIPFTIPEYLVEEVKAGRCVLFAGAGISTESSQVLPWTFYDEIKKELGLNEDISFPDLMTKFANQPVGRIKLIKKLQERFNYINGWADLRKSANNFHRELSTMPYISEVVTTNWDTYFEEHAAMRPFVYDADIPFWEASDRSVLKVHGSIENLSTLVATHEDYQECYRRLNEGLLGTILKQILATKTCVFIGYSLKDDDLRKIIGAISPQLGPFARQHYFVSPFSGDTEIDSLGLSMDFIKTDGTYFLRKLKERMCDDCCYATDESYDYLLDATIFAEDEHEVFLDEISVAENPVAMCNVFYQDGVVHALNRILDLKNSGKFSDLHSVQNKVQAYFKLADSNRKQKKYLDYSYYTGYANGLLCFLNFSWELDDDEFEDLEAESDGDFEFLPMYFHPKLEEISKEDYFEKVLNKPEVHKGALSECIKEVKLRNLRRGFVPQRSPFG